MSYSQYQPKRANPGGFALIVALHAAAIGAVMLIKGPQIIPVIYPPTPIDFIVDTIDPPPEPIALEQPTAPAPSHIDRVETEVQTPPTRTDWPTLPPSTGSGSTDAPAFVDPPATPPIDPPRPLPARVEAELDSRYASAFRPPYPPSELRAERNGEVRLRVTIGADGRVRAVERLSATSDAFWAAAERQALNRWRFRPATVDGRPVESTKVLTLRFRIEDA